MLKTKISTSDEATKIIKSGNSIVVSGNGEMLLPDLVLQSIERRFLSKGEPKDLTLFYPVIPGTQREGTGIDRFAHKGMLKRVISGSYYTLQVKKLCNLLYNNELEAYLFPMQANFQLLRAIANGSPGYFTKVGLGTFIDPRNGQYKLTSRTKEELIKIIKIDNEEYLFYKSFPIDIAIIRGTTADEFGNISIEEEPIISGILDIAMAAKNSGGEVIAQVKRLTKIGKIHPKNVLVPGIFVDKIVIDSEQQKFFPYNPYNTGDLLDPYVEEEIIPLTWEKIIARRASLYLRPFQVINIGFGIPSYIPSVAFEEGISKKLIFTVEHGPIGGIPVSKHNFGAGINMMAIMDSPDIFSFYNAGGLDICFLGIAQIDKEGNVNVSKIGEGKVNLGGFLDIIWNTPKIIFCGSFTAKGFNAKVDDGKIFINKEGCIQKFVRNVFQKTFSAKRAKENNQQVYYITERAVFKLTKQGIKLIEIAPGVDIKKDILNQMDFSPIIDSSVRKMPKYLFEAKKIGLINKF